MNCARITIAAVAAATALAAGVASAAVPSECITGPEVRSYEAAYECLGGGSGGEHAVASSSAALSVAIEPEAVCLRNGEKTGNITAEIYCAPPRPPCPECPLELPSIPIPCDAVDALDCKQAFHKYVNTHEDCRSKALNDPHVNKLVDIVCAPR
jgi:hypothetical protein